MVEEDVGFLLVHFAQDDDVGGVVLKEFVSLVDGWEIEGREGLTRSYSHGMS